MSKHNTGPEPAGKEHVRAMGRMGLAEIRGMLYPDSNVAQPIEQGIWGTKTTSEIAEDKRLEQAKEVEVEPHSVLHQIESRSASPSSSRAQRDVKIDMER